MAEKYHPGRQHKIEDRKERFEGSLEFVRARNGWITSVPGAPDVTIECLPDSRLPDDLRGLGYVVTAAGEGERILHSAITEQLVAGPDGELVPLTAGSTWPVALTVTHAGIFCKVKRYAFELP
jgi:hypothetical protein